MSTSDTRVAKGSDKPIPEAKTVSDRKSQQTSTAGASKTDATQKSTEVRSGKRNVSTHEQQGTPKMEKTAPSAAKAGGTPAKSDVKQPPNLRGEPSKGLKHPQKNGNQNNTANQRQDTSGKKGDSAVTKGKKSKAQGQLSVPKQQVDQPSTITDVRNEKSITSEYRGKEKLGGTTAEEIIIVKLHALISSEMWKVDVAKTEIGIVTDKDWEKLLLCIPLW